MNNNDKDNLRFNKLYELLGDDINSLYDTKDEDDIFASTEEKVEPVFNDVFNIFNHDTDDLNTIDEKNHLFVNNTNTDLTVTEVNNEIVNDEEIEQDNNRDLIINNDESKSENINEIFIEPTKINIEDTLHIEENENENRNAVQNLSNINGGIFRNKTIIGNDLQDDYEEDNGINKKRSIFNILGNKQFLYLMLILIFLVVCILVVKTFYFGKIVKVYNDYVDETEKESNGIIVYENKEIDDKTLKKAAASELISCISAPINVKELPGSVSSIIGDINKYYRSSDSYFAFTYKDIFTGFTVSYNEDGNIFAASTTKAPVNIYLYEMAKEGKINLDDELTYTSKYYNSGTGVLKNKKVNTNYTIRTLSQYAIRNSDNAAHNMLMDNYGRNNIKTYWQNKGTNIILTGRDNWGLINAHDAVIYMEELYKFYVDDNSYGNELMNNFVNTTAKFISGKNDYIVANKSGWSGNSIHDVSIVFAPNPYIVVALSKEGLNNNYMNYFNRVNDLAYNLHNEYWKYKMSECNKVSQYN